MFSLDCSWEGKGDSQGAGIFFFQTAVQHWVTSEGKRVKITSDWDLAFLYCLWYDWLIPVWFIDGFEKQFRFERPLWKIASQGCMRGMKPAAWMKTFNFFFFFAHSRPAWHLECFACTESLKAQHTLLWQESWGGLGCVRWLFSQFRSMLMCSTVALYQFLAVFKEPL